MEQCKHELPESECAICLGRWNHDIVSPTTGLVRSSREYIPWFVPGAAGHGGRGWADHVGVEQGNHSPSSTNSPKPVALPSSATPSVDMEIVGRPQWYMEQVMGEESVATRCRKAGLDWYGFLELHAAEVLLQVESTDREVWPTVEPEPDLPRYLDGVEAWRMASGRY